MATRTLIQTVRLTSQRCLHASSSRSNDPKPAANPLAALGLGNFDGRKRKLDYSLNKPISISPSQRRDVKSISPGASPDSIGTIQRKPPQPTRSRGNPQGSQQQSPRGQEESPELLVSGHDGETGEYTFSPRDSRRSGGKKFEKMDFDINDLSGNNNYRGNGNNKNNSGGVGRQRSQRSGEINAQGSGGDQRGGAGRYNGGNGNGSQRSSSPKNNSSQQRSNRKRTTPGGSDSTSSGPFTVSTQRVVSQKVPEQYDQSLKALFGRVGIIQRYQKGARHPEESIWAKAQGLQPAEARKTELLRLLGSYDIYKPDTPHPTTLPSKTKPAQLAQASAIWSMAQNQSITLRGQIPGKGVVDHYLG